MENKEPQKLKQKCAGEMKKKPLSMGDLMKYFGELLPDIQLTKHEKEDKNFDWAAYYESGRL